MIILINDTVIEAKVLEQKEAKEKYDDAISGGNAAVMLREESEEVLQLDIGNIMPGQKVEVKIIMLA